MRNNFAPQGGAVGMYHYYNYTRGFVRIENTKIIQNKCSNNNGGGMFITGNFGLTGLQIDIVNSEISSNVAGVFGGGLYAKSDNGSFITVNIVNSSINYNRSISAGGLFVDSSGPTNSPNTCTVTMTNSSVIGNTGGGIVSSASIASYLNVNNSSIIGNHSNTSVFGGVGGLRSSSAHHSIVSIVNSTVLGNASMGNGSGVNSSALYFPAIINITSSIVALNDSSNIYNSAINGYPNNSIINSGGFNIFSDSTISGSLNSDQLNIDSIMLNMDSVNFNGGSTLTSMPLGFSVALNMGSPTDTTDAQNVPVVGVRDVGAAESCQATLGVDFITACNLYTWIDGITYDSSNNSAQFIISNLAGCDSLVTLNLSLYSGSESIDTLSGCDSLTWMNGITYYSSNNVAKDTLVNSVGCDSIIHLNLTIFYSTDSIDVHSACNSFIWINGVNYYSSNNTDSILFTNSVGCDIILHLDLTIQNVDTNITQLGNSLISYATNATFQWFNCDSFLILPNETQNVFNYTVSGNYGVFVNQNNCLDTSNCIQVLNVGISEEEEEEDTLELSIFPNPCNQQFSISCNSRDIEKVIIFNVQGKIIGEVTSGFDNINCSKLNPGLYFIQVESQLERTTIKLIKE